jgi:hypothetical protein
MLRPGGDRSMLSAGRTTLEAGCAGSDASARTVGFEPCCPSGPCPRRDERSTADRCQGLRLSVASAKDRTRPSVRDITDHAARTFAGSRRSAVPAVFLLAARLADTCAASRLDTAAGRGHAHAGGAVGVMAHSYQSHRDGLAPAAVLLVRTGLRLGSRSGIEALAPAQEAAYATPVSRLDDRCGGILVEESPGSMDER